METVKNLYYLGPDGSNSYKAALKFINLGIQPDKYCKVPKKGIKSVFEALENDKTAIAVLPAENSIEGLVRETIDNLIKIKDETIKIQGEFSIPVNHMLMSKSGSITEIKTIYSHPQALAQCRGFLYENFPDAELKEVSSTSYAAEKVSGAEDKTLAAIANETCAGIFNLKIAAESINDEQDNSTRFYVLSRNLFKTSSNGKTAIVILPETNRTGVLCDILKIFASYKINLSCINSRPAKRHKGEYIFFIELDGYGNNLELTKALEELKSYAAFIKILGSFSVYE